MAEEQKRDKHDEQKKTDDSMDLFNRKLNDYLEAGAHVHRGAAAPEWERKIKDLEDEIKGLLELTPEPKVLNALSINMLKALGKAGTMGALVRQITDA
jgi:hypothetical protein